jgi:hypothetical protein
MLMPSLIIVQVSDYRETRLVLEHSVSDMAESPNASWVFNNNLANTV